MALEITGEQPIGQAISATLSCTKHWSLVGSFAALGADKHRLGTKNAAMAIRNTNLVFIVLLVPCVSFEVEIMNILPEYLRIFTDSGKRLGKISGSFRSNLARAS